MLIAELISGVPRTTDVRVAGRIVGILDDGFVLQDESGRIDVGWEGKVNVGDVVELNISPGVDIQAGSVVVLVACDDDFFIRKGDSNYRKMVLERDFLERMKRRAGILDSVRSFFKKSGFLEVETPSLVKLPGMEPYLDVFKTEFIGESQRPGYEMYLVTSPEYAMKKLLVGGAEKVFQICKSFRNKETDSTLHNPEFTLLEWYRAYASYEEIMKDTEELVESLAMELNGEPVVKFKGMTVNVSSPWQRISVKDAFRDFADIPNDVFEDEDKLREVVRKKGYKVAYDAPFDELFFVVFMNEIEPKLGVEKAVILKDYPLSMAALSKQCEENSKYAERFEAYVAGVELCNAFTELNDWREQEKRLELEREERKKLGKTDYAVDKGFIDALKFGMPPSGGNALGIDRLVMLLLDVSDIRDVLFFPHRDL